LVKNLNKGWVGKLLGLITIFKRGLPLEKIWGPRIIPFRDWFHRIVGKEGIFSTGANNSGVLGKTS